MRKSRQSGIALLMVLASMALLTVLSFEILFATRVDLRIGRNARDRLQAYYLAQSSARLSILRLHMYKEVRNLVDGGSPIPIPSEVIDRIWSAPLPQLPFAGMDVNWPGTLMGTIASEGSKIPINLLDGNVHRGSSPELQKQVREEIINLIKSQLEDEEFDKLYRGMKPEDLVDPLQDWIDADSNRQGGGDENSDYEKLEKPYRPRNDRMPSLSELHLVKGWTDDLIRRLAGNFSTLNLALEVNPNYIPNSRLKSIYTKFTDEDLQAIAQHRQVTPFKDLADMKAWINTNTKSGQQFTWPETMKDEPRQEIFQLESSGIVGEARRTLKLGIRFASEPKPTPSASPTPGAPPPKPGKLLEPIVVTIEEAQ